MLRGMPAPELDDWQSFWELEDYLRTHEGADPDSYED